jgi:hypothetical protein
MGGIVAAETLLSLVAEAPAGSRPDHLAFTSPYIQGILAFDTPYLGVAPDAVAHSAEQHWKTVSSVYSHLAVAFGLGGQDAESSGGGGAAAAASHKMLPAPSTSSATEPAQPPYRKIAMFAAAVGAVAVGSTAAYAKKNEITQGVTWMTSHLEFVGVLARPKEMQARLEKIAELTASQGLGFCNIYTTLGHAVSSERRGHNSTDRAAGSTRFFCNLPSGRLSDLFVPAINDKATSEVAAHTSMFERRSNPGYDTLCNLAKDKIVAWTETTDWYKEREGPLGREIEHAAGALDRRQVDRHPYTSANQKQANRLPVAKREADVDDIRSVRSKTLGLKRANEATEDTHDLTKRRKT